MNKELLSTYWDNYKADFGSESFKKSEAYKWNLFNQMYSIWNWKSDASNFEMYTKTFHVDGPKNLWQSGNFFPISMLTWMWEKFPIETEQALNILFDETVDLSNRMEKFASILDNKLPELAKLITEKPINQHYHGDLRAISIYLTLQFPEKYFLYKHTVFKDFSSTMDLPPVKTGKTSNYLDYLSICNELRGFIQSDQAFLLTYKSYTSTNDLYPDPYLHLLIQDFMLFTMSHNKSTQLTNGTKYWLYAPGENANMWEDFHKNGIMGLGWDELGDLTQYSTKEEIATRLKELYEGDTSKANDATANVDFRSSISVGDIVIAKKGRNAYLGYGIVTSDYYFDDSVPHYKHKRNVNWVKSGHWESEHSIALKTLTDITNLPYKPNPSILAHEAILNIMNDTNPEEMNHPPLNQILYGPPGTGKTFSTTDVVVDILEPNNNYTRIQKKAKFNLLINDNRAFFTTFHQSMSYEEFIEGIKPKTVKDQVQYEITNGILKDICDLCFEDIKEMKALSISDSFELSFKEKFQEFGKAIQQGIIELKTRSGITVKISKISSAGNLQLNSGEDTRDYIISMKRLEKLAKSFPNPSVIKNIHEEIRSVIGGSNSSLYFAALEAFVSFEKKITETVKKDGKEISLSEIQLSEEEIAALPPYFLIIDEINRGNVSAIFGELITLIEEDKRFGKTNQLFVKLPYSREEFILPPNLYIIGTMNTADRSVEALDTALRRRFSFVEMLPDASKLENKQIEGIDLALMLNTLNERIEVLVDRDHTIGHAFFMNIESLADLRSAFANKIVPLLQEYFYGNYQKMEMVIGSAFFNITEANKVKFAVKSDEFDADGTVYHIKNISHEDGMSDTVFIEALNQLIKGA
jgi:Cdc6-like AAA superfamily ATPase